MNKNMYIYQNMDQTGETEFFFDDKKLITAIDGNDAHYRSEYMDCLFENFGVKVSSIEKLNSAQKKDYQQYMKDRGIEKYVPEKEATKKEFDYYSLNIPSAFGYQDVSFLINKKTKNAKEFIKMVERVIKNNKDKHDQITELRINYLFEDKAIKLSKAGNGNYLTSRKTMSDRCLVLEVNAPKKGFNSIKSNVDFWNFISFNDKSESQAMVIEKFTSPS